ncbi:MAG TPA: hypothetical protein VG273_16350 [Bryobacteraceae bacterium]|nr:hypothetical protein [Bryobacteraceae bacterium]
MTQTLPLWLVVASTIVAFGLGAWLGASLAIRVLLGPTPKPGGRL